MTSIPAQTLYMQIGRKRYQITSFQEASEKFSAARERFGKGASKTPTPLLINQRGDVIGYVSYNGRVWSGMPSEWQSGQKPLFDNRVDAP